MTLLSPPELGDEAADRPSRTRRRPGRVVLSVAVAVAVIGVASWWMAASPAGGREVGFRLPADRADVRAVESIRWTDEDRDGMTFGWLEVDSTATITWRLRPDVPFTGDVETVSVSVRGAAGEVFVTDEFIRLSWEEAPGLHAEAFSFDLALTPFLDVVGDLDLLDHDAWTEYVGTLGTEGSVDRRLGADTELAVGEIGGREVRVFGRQFRPAVGRLETICVEVDGRSFDGSCASSSRTELRVGDGLLTIARCGPEVADVRVWFDETPPPVPRSCIER